MANNGRLGVRRHVGAASAAQKIKSRASVCDRDGQACSCHHAAKLEGPDDAFVDAGRGYAVQLFRNGD